MKGSRGSGEPDGEGDRTEPWTPQGAEPDSKTWTCSLGGRAYELDVHPGMTTRLVLRVDGEVLHDKASSDEWRTITTGPGRRVEVRLANLGKVRRATVHDGPRDLDFDAPAGSRAARTQQWGRAHPTLFALRHVAIKGGLIVIALLGLGALFKALIQPIVRWITDRIPQVDLPDIALPDIPWPRIRWPAIPWPDIPWPQITLPDWVITLITWLDQYDHIVKPLLIGLVLALGEMRRQRRQRRLRDSGAVDDPGGPAGARAATSVTPGDDRASDEPQSDDVPGEKPPGEERLSDEPRRGRRPDDSTGSSATHTAAH